MNVFHFTHAGMDCDCIGVWPWKNNFQSSLWWHSLSILTL